MYEQIREDTLFCMLYASAAMLSLTACCYLLFRRGNAFAPDITTPLRLRRWTAAFFASATLSHVWYLPIAFLTSSEDMILSYLIGTLLDCIILVPSAIAILFTLLQDRRRPLWPVGVMIAPLAVIHVLCIANHSVALLPLVRIYLLLLGIALTIYMIRAVRQYGRWLRNNYADLEHKEVWQSFMVLAIILLVFGIYTVADWGPIYQYVLQLNDIVLICYLLWRVETLSDLSVPIQSECATEEVKDNVLALAVNNNIETLLKQHCEDSKLYLQHDISVSQLAKLIGTNRVYLSKYFAMQGVTYNTYINGLRIKHFIKLYHERLATHQPIIAKQLAFQSGFRSYSTFGTAFKQTMGMTATEWMRSIAE